MSWRPDLPLVFLPKFSGEFPEKGGSFSLSLSPYNGRERKRKLPGPEKTKTRFRIHPGWKLNRSGQGEDRGSD
jgi:hypothetical protein